jgi:hypothetical protein
LGISEERAFLSYASTYMYMRQYCHCSVITVPHVLLTCIKVVYVQLSLLERLPAPRFTHANMIAFKGNPPVTQFSPSSKTGIVALTIYCDGFRPA